MVKTAMVGALTQRDETNSFRHRRGVVPFRRSTAGPPLAGVQPTASPPDADPLSAIIPSHV